MDQFANDTPEQRDEAFQEAAARLGMSKAIIEKDFWVCWSLKQLFALPSFGDHMIFKGGTSLSKAYDVIHRFSEDVDLSLDRAQLGFEGDRDPENPDLSGKKQKQLLQELQDAAEAEVSGPLLAEIQAAFDASLEQGFALTVDPGDAQTLLFAYPSLSDSAGGYVKPIVRFEFGARGVHLPSEVREISPYVHQAFPDLLGSGVVDVKVLGVERTFWEKATILHMLFHQDPTKPLADRMSRHYYDMAQLIGHEAKGRAVGSLDLLEHVAHHKSVFFKAAWANYEAAKPGSLRLIPNAELTAALRRDYSGMREMIIGDAPGFDDILSAIEAFEAEINS
ncbi:nucleotidyl transferase AbiEii/AbiGii toxin family protein [Vannielia litorea]|uniref:nucleotidyl transferase AbiEii/AbiGii toxin family protein n=1 Tax=Vannielia litorea TaxID=1217970 RepID=UPI001BCF971B|nr:nucleotidyl transferase AbiEii/AbiGii toxin family protein [Vannielia litorea]MBS8224850.1 nucleotidyl transferase AbiEii/AbiGii toxin family protein [Vannielia litorea]